MIIRPAREIDFPHLETFVWQAIFPAFNFPGLNAAQRQENDGVVETARAEVIRALAESRTAVFVALDAKHHALLGYLIADGAPKAYAEIRQLIVKRSHWGKGVATGLLLEAIHFIGRERALAVAVRHYNARAIAFFVKHGFVNTEETTGNFAIPRTLLLREALEEIPLTVEDKRTPETPISSWEDDFPTGADEPIFESLPNYNLRVEETPLFIPGSNALTLAAEEEYDSGESSLTEDQLTELEAFIARARAKKGTKAPPITPLRTAEPAKQPSPNFSKTPFPKAKAGQLAKQYDRNNITFEVDYGNGSVQELDDRPVVPVSNTNLTPQSTPSVAAKASFEFDFEKIEADSTQIGATKERPLDATVAPQVMAKSIAEAKVKVEKGTKYCPNCAGELPVVARFCFRCGFPQPASTTAANVGGKAPAEEKLVLEELPETLDEGTSSGSSFFAKTANPTAATKEGKKQQPESKDQHTTTAKHKQASKTYTLGELKTAFREHLQERLMAYFGDRKLKAFFQRLENHKAFQALRDGSLINLMNWLNAGVPRAAARRRLHNTLADLTEYFVVETAGDLSDHVLPQRLLRHQSIDWETADLFKVVMDYLDFEKETERVYTDFVTMPARALRNATKSFLQAKKDERIFFICDQSLISQAKNGFAITDAGLYWKNVLQPAGVVTYTTLERIRLEQGHLQLDGQFFNAGGRLNLKIAVLLDKLKRM